jgi:hypothetical protein
VLGVAALLVVVVIAAVSVSRSDSFNPPRQVSDAPDRPSRGQSSVHVGTDELPFSPTSFWNRPIADDAPLASDSEDLVAAFNHQWQTYYGTVGINTDAYSIPIYTVPADQPTVSVSTEPGCTWTRGSRSRCAPSPSRPELDRHRSPLLIPVCFVVRLDASLDLFVRSIVASRRSVGVVDFLIATPRQWCSPRARAATP